MATADDAGLLSQLRRATRDRHDRIEAVLCLDRPVDFTRYARIVHVFHVFLDAWEPQVRHALPARLQPWFDARRRGPLAEADLRYLGAPPAPAVARDAGGCRRRVAALPVDTLPGAFGSMYVIEGSALGGQVLVPRLAAALGVAPGRGASYFHGFGERTGALWKDFRRIADAEVGASPAAVQAACAGACRTFDALAACFEELAA